jgi:hypothetical protein
MDHADRTVEGAAPPPFPAFDETRIRSLAASIDRNGYADIPDYIRPDDLAHIQSFVVDAVARAGNQYVGYAGHSDLTGTVLERVATSAAFRSLCERVYTCATGRPAPDQPFYQVLRCLAGASGRKHSLMFHYDSYVLTALLPILVPPGKLSGELLVLPNARPIRRSYLTNLIDKVAVDNPLSQRVFRRMAERGSPRMVRIAMVPGHLYLFWGYRSLHTNEPCDPDKIRATALLHYGEPHRDSRLRRWLR